tara:strand:- start:2177 stop:2368 length:192 start_codon:yes stop_codon:yes gene_type:complete
MNSIKSYKAISIVANIEQGLLIKRLIKENKELIEKNKELKKKHQVMIKGLVKQITFNGCMHCM